MSNTKNLANLAAALDDGTSGQVLQSTGSGGVQFADSSGSGVTTHTNQAALISADTSSAYTEGSLHFDLNANVLYVKIGSGAGDGFYAVATVENAAPSITSFSENTGGAGANDLTNATPPNTFTLTAGSNTVITINATEPNLETISYSATVTSGTATDVFSSPSFPVTNQSSNVFTLTPVTSGTGGTVTIRFDASDGTNVGSVSHSFEIAFIVADSHYTTLLMATDGSAGDNQDDITDAAGNHTNNITVSGDAHVGTFSPYRHGGYSVEFVDQGSNGYGLQLPAATFNNPSTTFTIEAWVYLKSYTNNATGHYNRAIMGKGATYLNFGVASDYKIQLYHYDGTARYPKSTGTVPLNEWTHVCAKVDSGSITFYINGSSSGTGTWYGLHSGHVNTDFYVGMTPDTNNTANNDKWWDGYLSNVRFVDGTAITPTSGGNEALDPATTNTEFLLCASNRFIDSKSTSPLTVTPYRTPKIVPIAPYDYNEYSASDNGGSAYFDGNSDYLDVSGSTSLDLDSTDWTIEGWVYRTSTGSIQTLVNTAPPHTTLIISLNRTGGGNTQVYTGNGSSWVGSPAIDSGSNYPLLANEWSHVAVVKSGTTLYLYHNGKQAGSTTTLPTGFTGNFRIGAYESSGSQGEYLNGYVSDFRVAKEAVYTGEFTPPSGPLTTTGGTYPSTTNVDTSITAELLLSGTDAHVLDKSQSGNIKLYGNAASAAITHTGFDSYALRLQGSNSNHIRHDGSIELDGPFTVEAWFNASAFGGYIWCVGMYRVELKIESTQARYYEAASGYKDFSYGSTLNTGQWYHIAVCRDANNLIQCWLDGTRLSSSYTVSTTYEADYTIIGGEASASDGSTANYVFNGYIQDLRVSNGLARYTAADETSNIPSSALKG